MKKQNHQPSLITITPAVAAQMLEMNTANRPLTEGHVLSLSREMMGGRWKINGDMIRISATNNIIDGQHRLHAVVRSGITIQSWVIWGLNDDVFDTIDVGKRRTSGDTLSCRGEKNAARLAAALIMIEKYMTGRAEKSIRFSNTEVEGLLAKYPEARESVMSSISGKGLLLPSVLDACHYLFSKKDLVMTAVFMEKIFKGIGLEEGDPWYALRERLLMNSMSTAKLSKALLMALCIKAWNAARQGKRISKLQLNVVEGKMGTFPVVL
jgi:hypothetical protein